MASWYSDSEEVGGWPDPYKPLGLRDIVRILILIFIFYLIFYFAFANQIFWCNYVLVCGV